MKAYLLPVLCLILSGCERPAANPPEAPAKPDAAKAEPAKQRGDTVRWAFVSKRESEMSISEWSRDMQEAARKAEVLTPEMEGKVRQYDSLQAEFNQKRMEGMRYRMPQPGMPGEIPAQDKDLEALNHRLAEARAPIADLLERRSVQAAQFQKQYTVEKLVAEYAKGRFEVVVDSSDSGYGRSPVLYRSADEVLDITAGVLRLFKEKIKQP